MSVLGHVLLAIALIVGLFFNTMGVLGILRFPDVYTRLHADTKATTFGSIFLALSALLLVARDWIHAPGEWGAWLNLGIHILFALIVLLVTNATGGHAIARAAWRAGHRPANLAVDRLTNPSLPPPPPADPAATTMEMAAISVLVAPPAKDAPAEEEPEPAVKPAPVAEPAPAVEPEQVAEQEQVAEPEQTVASEPTVEPEPIAEPEQVAEAEPVEEPAPAVAPEPAAEPAPGPAKVPTAAFASIFGVQNILDFQTTPDPAPPAPADAQSASLSDSPDPRLFDLPASDSTPPTPTEDA